MLNQRTSTPHGAERAAQKKIIITKRRGHPYSKNADTSKSHSSATAGEGDDCQYHAIMRLTSFEESKVPLLVAPLQLSTPLVKTPHHALLMTMAASSTTEIAGRVTSGSKPREKEEVVKETRKVRSNNDAPCTRAIEENREMESSLAGREGGETRRRCCQAQKTPYSVSLFSFLISKVPITSSKYRLRCGCTPM